MQVSFVGAAFANGRRLPGCILCRIARVWPWYAPGLVWGGASTFTGFPLQLFDSARLSKCGAGSKGRPWFAGKPTAGLAGPFPPALPQSPCHSGKADPVGRRSRVGSCPSVNVHCKACLGAEGAGPALSTPSRSSPRQGSLGLFCSSGPASPFGIRPWAPSPLSSPPPRCSPCSGELDDRGFELHTVPFGIWQSLGLIRGRIDRP